MLKWTEKYMLINGVNTMLREPARLILTKNTAEGQKRLKLGGDDEATNL